MTATVRLTVSCEQFLGVGSVHPQLLAMADYTNH